MKQVFTILFFIATTFLKPAIIQAQNANVADSLVLINLYDSTNGKNWTNNSGWLAGPVVNWYGVTLDSNGRVTQLGMYYNQLSGNLPSLLGNLSQLTKLGLAFGQIGGTVPASLGGLSKLTDLELEGNQLSGSIPSTLGNLTNLADLELYSNQLTGGIPASLGTLSNLIYLRLYSNQLNGSISSSLGNLNNLNVLRLDNNQLSGDIPASLGNLNNLTDLELNNNQLSGSIPASLGNNTYLNNLELNNNQLSGAIPSSLGSLVNVKTLNLSNNQLSGGIPSSLGSLANVQDLFLNVNKLTDTIPSSLGSLSALQYLDFDNNLLSGSIPSSFGSLTKLQGLNLSANLLSGAIPASLGSLSQLQQLTLIGNQLSGAIPSSFGNLTNLQGLDLSYNRLSGPIPSSFGNFANLASLNLQNNNFTFNGMEAIVKKYKFVVYSPQDSILPLHYINSALYVSAGGTLSNNSYTWHKGDTLLTTATGDSTYKTAVTGNYWVTITNAVATALTLHSDTFALTNAVLPLTFLNFTGQLSHGNTLLNWQTAAEINTAYFNIQRSADGIRFNTVGKVTAASNSTLVQNYAYIDDLSAVTPQPAVLYYRLQEVDKDFGINFSRIIELTILPGDASFVIFPNPVHDVLNVRLNGITGAVGISIAGADGKRLQAQQLNIAAGGQYLTINTSLLAAGIYILQVEYNGQSQVQKFVKWQ